MPSKGRFALIPVHFQKVQGLQESRFYDKTPSLEEKKSIIFYLYSSFFDQKPEVQFFLQFLLLQTFA